MEANRWQQVEAIVEGALAIKDSERGAWLDSQCHGNASLRAEVESLLAFENESAAFLARPPAGEAATFLTLVEAANGQSGRRVGPYKIVRELGRGGMASVFEAVRDDGQFSQRIALKLIRGSLGFDEETRRRFLHERQILAQLEHPHIAHLLDGGTTEDGTPYLAMEYVDGQPLDEFSRSRNLSVRERLELFMKVGAAVAYAHRNLVIHRDLKPSNIFVEADGTPKLLDFGVAKLLDSDEAHTVTMTGLRAYTPDYASPEQVLGKHITTASDIYSLGIILYELLSGQRPHKLKDASPEQRLSLIANTEPVRPSRAVPELSADHTTQPNPKVLRGDLDNITLMALRRDPSRRYRSVEEFVGDIERHLKGLPVIARKDTVAYRASKFIGRNKIGVTVGALVLAMMFVGAVMIIKEKRQADRRFNDVRRLANAVLFDADTEIQKGPTKARAMIVRRSLEYLDGLAQEAGSDPGLQLELAMGYLTVGDIQGKPYRPNLGDTAGALASYRKAQTLLTSLVAATPGNLEARRYLSLSYQNIGRVQRRGGDWQNAWESSRKAVEIGEALVKEDPNNAAYRNLLADNYLHFGESLYDFQRGATVADHQLAIEYFRKALAIHSSLAAADPGNVEFRRATGVDYEYVGIAFNRLGDMTGDAKNYEAALENHLKEQEINETIAASDRTNAAYRRALADVYGEVGLSLLKLKRPTEALDKFRKRANTFQELQAADPTNIEARRDVANAYNDVAQAQARMGNVTEAFGSLEMSILILEGLRAADPTPETLVLLAHSYDASAGMLKDTGDLKGALVSYKKASAVLESGIKAQPDNVLLRRLLANEYRNVASLHETIAADPKTSSEKRWQELQEAKLAYQQSASLWQQPSSR